MPTPNDALAYAKRFVGNIPVDDSAIHYRILDDAHKKLWMARPWPWTVASLENFTLVNDFQDIPLSNTYSDMLYLLQAKITNGQEQNDIMITSILPATTTIKGRPSQLAYLFGVPEIIRFLPVPTGYTTAPKVLITYKKKSIAITNLTADTDYQTLTGTHTEWFWVYQEIVLLKAFQFTHDPRLGSVTVGPNGTQYTGQYAVVEAAIAEMWRNLKKLHTTVGDEVNA